jgi:hypothetical protein
MGTVVSTYNPSYLRGWSRKIASSKQPGQRNNPTLKKFFKNLFTLLPFLLPKLSKEERLSSF